MMSADECRKRADACLAEAIRATHLDDQRSWHALAELWLLRHDQLSETPATREWQGIATNTKNGAVAAAVSETASSDNDAPAVTGDRLRSLLRLTENAISDNEAQTTGDRLRSLLRFKPHIKRIFERAPR